MSVAIRNLREPAGPSTSGKRDRASTPYQLTRSVCPECLRFIDAQLLVRQGKLKLDNPKDAETSATATQSFSAGDD